MYENRVFPVTQPSVIFFGGMLYGDVNWAVGGIRRGDGDGSFLFPVL